MPLQGEGAIHPAIISIPRKQSVAWLESAQILVDKYRVPLLKTFRCPNLRCHDTSENLNETRQYIELTWTSVSLPGLLVVIVARAGRGRLRRSCALFLFGILDKILELIDGREMLVRVNIQEAHSIFRRMELDRSSVAREF